MKKVLLVEDDHDLYELVKYNLEKAKFLVAGSKTGKNAVELCRSEQPDLILLDIVLPKVDGLEICRALKADVRLAPIPVIFLTARNAELDRLLGFEVGAKDYVVKPFFISELLVRIKVQLQHPLRPQVLTSGKLRLDRTSYQVWVGGREVKLPRREFRLLEFFMEHPNIVFSREQLLKAVWNGGHEVFDQAVGCSVYRLRRAIGESFIYSSRCFGYSFLPNEN